MIDKSLVKRRFKKSFSTYNDNAIVQKKMAERLIQYLPFKQYNSVLEIGCATGVLTKLIAENIRTELDSRAEIAAEAPKTADEPINAPADTVAAVVAAAQPPATEQTAAAAAACIPRPWSGGSPRPHCRSG